MAIGDVVDANGNIVTPATQPAGGEGGGAGGLDADESAKAFGYGVVKGIPFGSKIASAGVPIAMQIGNALNWLKGGPNEDQIKAMGGLPQDYTSASEALAQKGGQAAEEHPYLYAAGTALPQMILPGGGSIKGAAGYGAALGVGEGESPADSAARAVLGGAGGALGAGAAKAVLPAAGFARQTILDAAKRLNVTMPRYSVGLPITQQLGKVGFSVPGAAAPLEEATHESIAGLGTAAETAAAGATKETAGAAASSGLKGWIGPVSKGDVDAKYNAVTQALTNPSAKTPLSALQSVAQKINLQRGSLQDPSGALAQVAKALQTGQGTYGEIKALRTSVGEMIDSGVLPAGVQGSELKQIYGALSSDLERSAYTAGGQSGVAAHQAATQFAAETNARREQLVKLLGGPQAGASDEAVFGAIKRVASTKDNANIALLKQALSVIPPQSRDELSRGFVAQMGRDAEGNFSTARFLTDYGNISDKAKDELFAQGGQLRQNLDDLATVSKQWKSLGRYANPSGTAGHGATMGLAAEATHDPLKAIAIFLGAKGVGKLLSTPAGAGASANWVRAMASGDMDQIRNAATRIAGTAGAQIGARLDPMVVAAWALHHYGEGGEGGGDQGGGGGNVPQ